MIETFYIPLFENSFHIRKVEGTKGVIRSRKSKDRQHNG